MNLYEWAIKWGIPHAAIQDFQRQAGLAPDEYAGDVAAGSEAYAQSAVRLEASRKGYRIWRNNVGAGYMQDGSFLRFGLANDSKAVNDVVKSSDLIGIAPGGQFVAREIKAPGWRYTGTEREKAQLAFISLILSYGGNAGFATGDGTL
jgi:hypothetical protein